MFANFFHCKIIHNLFPYCTLWKDVTMYNPHLSNGDLCSTSLMGNSYTKYLKSLCMEIWSLYQYRSWVLIKFILRAIFQYYFTYFIVDIISAVAFRDSFSWLLYLFDKPLSFVLLNTSSLSDTTRHSRIILYILCISPHWNIAASGLFQQTELGNRKLF